jgi:ribosome-binding factor A
MRIDGNRGSPHVTWTPDLGTARVYSVAGKTNLAEGAWGATNGASRFFRVKVDLP